MAAGDVRGAVNGLPGGRGHNDSPRAGDMETAARGADSLPRASSTASGGDLACVSRILLQHFYGLI